MAPMEQSFGYDPIGFQDTLTNEFIDRLRQNPAYADKNQDRMFLFLMSKTITSKQAYKSFSKIVRELGFERMIVPARRCGDMIHNDVRAAARQFFKAFDVDRSDAWFYTFDIRNKSMHRESI